MGWRQSDFGVQCLLSRRFSGLLSRRLVTGDPNDTIPTVWSASTAVEVGGCRKQLIPDCFWAGRPHELEV